MEKIMFAKWFAVALIIGLVPGLVPAQDPAAIIAEADQLGDDEKYEESNKLLMELAKTNPGHPDVYWKISQNFYDMGERIDIEEDKARKLDM